MEKIILDRRGTFKHFSRRRKKRECKTSKMSLNPRTIQDLWSHLVQSPAQSSISQITLLMAMSSCVLNISRTGGFMTSRKLNKSCTHSLITKAIKEAGNWMSGVQLSWKGPEDLVGQWAELSQLCSSNEGKPCPGKPQEEYGQQHEDSQPGRLLCTEPDL